MEQKHISSPTWLSKLQNEAASIDIEINLEEVQNNTKEGWMKAARKKIMDKEESNLVEWKKTSKKYGDMNGEITLREYCKNLNSHDGMLILKARLGMVEAKANYKNMHHNTSCGKCGQTETTEHLITCYMENTPENEILMQNFSNDIKNIDKVNISHIKNISGLLAKSLKIRASTREASAPPLPPHDMLSCGEEEEGDLTRGMDKL